MRAELTIARVGLMGQGVGYDAEGNIYFVPGAIPGDRVAVEIGNSRKKYRDAELVEILAAGPERREPACPHFTQCGGCDFLHWEYPAQQRAKDEILRHVLERADLKAERFLPMLGAQQPEGYRNRIQVRRRGERVGFMRKRTRDLIDVEKCLIADPRLNEALTQLRSEPPTSDEMHKIELYVREDGTVARVVDRPHAADGFAQVNVAQNDVLKALVASHLEARGARNVLELFCGNGNFARHYVKQVERVVGVDVSQAALADGRARRAPEDEKKLLFLQGFVGRATLRNLPPDFRNHYDTLIIDPPRTGAGCDLSDFDHPDLKTIVYISCSPVSFSQDVQSLKKHFRLVEVQAVDMFPHTRHIEFVARFERR